MPATSTCLSRRPLTCSVPLIERRGVRSMTLIRAVSLLVLGFAASHFGALETAYSVFVDDAALSTVHRLTLLAALCLISLLFVVAFVIPLGWCVRCVVCV